MATKFLRKIILEELQNVLNASELEGVRGYNELSPEQKRQANSLYMRGGVSARDVVRQVKALPTPGVATPRGEVTSVQTPRVSDIAGVQKIQIDTPEERRAAVKKLQMQMVKKGVLKPNEAVGNFGPKTRLYANSFFGVSGQEALNEKDVTMMTAADISRLARAIETQNKEDGRQMLASFHMRINKGLQAADAASSQSGKTKLAADLAAANQGRSPADVVLNTDTPLDKKRGVATPSEPSSDEFRQRMLQGQRDLNRKMNEPPTKINAPKTSFKRQEESIAREIKKLLRSI